jgi:hypothetical protein
MRVFIAESNSPYDFYRGRLDGFAANEVLKVRGIASRYRIAFNLERLKDAIKEAERYKADIFHLSCHGNANGVGLCDGTSIDWPDFSTLFRPFAHESKLLVLSSCEGGHGGIAKAFQKTTGRFGYICGSTDPGGVTFHDSCVAWSILYNVLVKAEETEIERRDAMREAIRKINLVVSGRFVYRRWSQSKQIYRYFPAEEDSE